MGVWSREETTQSSTGDEYVLRTSMRAIIALIISILLGLSLYGCKPVVNELAFHPDNANVIPTNKLPDDIQEITISTEDQVNITSLYLPSTKSKKLLIYFHGNAGNIYHRMSSLRQIQQFGINVIGVSYRGYGKSEGEPSEAGVYVDGQAAFQYAVEHLGFSSENIILFGRSIGTAVAVQLAQHKKLAGMILVSPLTSGKDIAAASALAPLSSLAGNAFDNLSKVEHITSPLLVIHGTADRIVPFSMGKLIYERATVKKQFVAIEGADHNNVHAVDERAYWLPIRQFIH